MPILDCYQSSCCKNDFLNIDQKDQTAWKLYTVSSHYKSSLKHAYTLVDVAHHLHWLLFHVYVDMSIKFSYENAFIATRWWWYQLILHLNRDMYYPSITSITSSFWFITSVTDSSLNVQVLHMINQSKWHQWLVLGFVPRMQIMQLHWITWDRILLLINPRMRDTCHAIPNEDVISPILSR